MGTQKSGNSCKRAAASNRQRNQSPSWDRSLALRWDRSLALRWDRSLALRWERSLALFQTICNSRKRAAAYKRSPHEKGDESRGVIVRASSALGVGPHEGPTLAVDACITNRRLSKPSGHVLPEASSSLWCSQYKALPALCHPLVLFRWRLQQ